MTGKIRRVAFEQALSMTGFARYNLCIFILCSSIIMGMGFEIFSVSYLVPASVCELNTTSAQQGLIACVPLAGIIATSHIWGYLADTKGRRKIVIISMAMSFVTGTCAAFSPNWIVLSFFKFLSSASVSGGFALSLTLLSESTPMARRSMFVILTTSVFLVATGCMAVIAIPILPLKFSYYVPVLDIHFNSWRLLDLIFALPSAISAIGMACAYESPKYLLTAGQEQKALEALRGMYVMNTRKSPESFEVDVLVLDEENVSALHKGFFKSIVIQTLPMLKPPFLKHTLLLSLLFVINYICMNSFTVWMPYIVNAFMTAVINGDSHLTVCEMIKMNQNSSNVAYNEDCSMNSTAMMMVFCILIILAALNMILSGLVNYVGRKKILIGIQLVSGSSALFIMISPHWILTGVLYMIFMAGVLNVGFLSTFALDVYPTYVRAMAVCMTVMVGRASAVLGINVLKQLLDFNCDYVFYIFGSLAFLGGLIAFLLPSEAQLLAKKKLKT